MNISDWIAFGAGLGGWVAAIIALIGLVYQKRGMKRVKEDSVEQLTKELLYISLYYAMDPMRKAYFPNEKTIDLTKEWIARVHAQTKQRLMQEV